MGILTNISSWFIILAWTLFRVTEALKCLVFNSESALELKSCSGSCAYSATFGHWDNAWCSKEHEDTTCNSVLEMFTTCFCNEDFCNLPR